jgi:uncharacterized damage-inducible protein DinB
MPPADLTLVATLGYAPVLGRLVSMLGHVRATTLQAVAGLAIAELDHLHDERSNSIGALLAHIAAVEWYYQLATFDQRAPSAEEMGLWGPALDLGPAARESIRGRPLAHYLERLAWVRDRTLEGLREKDDAWLELAERHSSGRTVNRHWQWFHVAEDELSHRGQIRWLRARLPG